MADVHTPERRSRNMRAIRDKNTKPELLLRRMLHARGFRFRLHVKDLPGKPDIVLPKYHVAIFVHGCFWHGHSCYLFKLPATRRDFWEAKINSNRARDIRDQTALRGAGWRLLVVWECAVKGRLRHADSAMIDAVERWIKSGSNQATCDCDQLP